MTRMRLALAAVLLAGTAGLAHADEKANAMALFDEGIKDMKEKNYAKACKAFEASNRLMPDSGTRGSLARCYTQLGKLASAWTLWRELADTAPTADLRSDAAAQAKKLEARLPKYAVKVTAPPPGLSLTVAGEPVDVSLDVPVPIDPGTYPVEAKAPGRVSWQGQLTATEGKVSELAVPELAAVSAEVPERPPQPGTPGRGRRITGVAFTVVGAGGLVAGAVFGAMARSHNEDAKTLCGGDLDRCDPLQTNAAQVKVDDARSAARLSTIGFIAGGALAAAGIVLYVTAPKRERLSVAVSPFVDTTSAGFALTGRY